MATITRTGNVTHRFLTAVVAAFMALDLKAETVTSPSGDIQLTIDDANGLSYSVTAFGEPVILSSPIRMACEGADNIGASMTLGKVSKNSNDSSWKPVVAGRRSIIRDHYNEIVCELNGEGSVGPGLTVRARAYDDGVAFRCEFTTQGDRTNVVNLSESTEFRFPSDARCWAADYGSYNGHQEAKFEDRRLSGLNQNGYVGLPLVVEMKNDLYIAIAEASLVNHAGMYLKRKSGEAGQAVTLVNHTSGNVSALLPHDAPWRMLMIARKPVKFLENDMLLNLNEPCDLKDTEWIKPGMMAWDHWWSGDVKMDTATLKEYIQLAADMGWPYQLIDWQWYGEFDKADADITKVNPAVDMPEVLRFAKEKGVRCWLWLYWTDVDRNDAYLKAFALYEQWGIAGVKIDFMQRDDQWMVNWYEKIIRKAAEHHLMVDFHGAYKPTGERRTLPNMVTREGVLGNEWNKWEPRTDPEHKCTLAFTRNLLGEMDFTPGGFRNRAQHKHADGGGSARVPGTRAQELALFVVYESPVMCACDSPANYMNQAGADFLKLVPTTWDETVGVDGKISDYVVVAKRKGQEWFLGAMTDWDARALTVPLDFLGKGSYVAKIWKDAEDSGVNAENLVQETQVVTAADGIYLFLASGGGAVVQFIPTDSTSAPLKSGPPSEWTACNDFSWTPGQTMKNINSFSPTGTRSGPLRDLTTGEALPVTVTIGGNAANHSVNGSNPPKGSPADKVFGGDVDCLGYLNFSEGALSIRFEGLNPKQKYAFALYGSRNDKNYTNRWTDVKIVGARSLVNKSGPSAQVVPNKTTTDTARILAANMDGSIWHFDEIVPAADGHVEFIVTPGGNGSTGGYVNAFMFQTAEKSSAKE